VSIQILLEVDILYLVVTKYFSPLTTVRTEPRLSDKDSAEEALQAPSTVCLTFLWVRLLGNFRDAGVNVHFSCLALGQQKIHPGNKHGRSDVA
jgi:hypothetical protein